MLLGLPVRAQDEIRIGAVLPITGKESKIGGAYKQATELAVKEANNAGGVQVGAKKMKVNLVLLDDTSDAAKSAQLVEQLITQDKVHAIIGGYGSHLVQAQSVVPDRYGVPFLSGGAERPRSSAGASGCSDALAGRASGRDADGLPRRPGEAGKAEGRR
jgi:ABC-type branched-subunit amino acid transport system substrate-binding protein